MADSTTTLNSGVGGDVVDQELVTQSDGVTTAKASRVVIRGKTTGAIADLQNADPGASPWALPTMPTALVNDTPSVGYVPGETRALSLTPEGRLRVSTLPAMIEVDFFGDDALDFTGQATFSQHNPWES